MPFPENKKGSSINRRTLLFLSYYLSPDYFTESAAAVSTAAVSTAAESTVTAVESAAGAVSAALGAQDAKARATTQNNNTFFISSKSLKFNMLILLFKIDAKIHHFFILNTKMYFFLK
jgi:predicted DNA-binding transcriptional regulator YafY